MRIELESHFGAEVYTNKNTDYLRRNECLCLNCKSMSKCPIAKQLFTLCVENDLAMMMTRCKSFIYRAPKSAVEEADT